MTPARTFVELEVGADIAALLGTELRIRGEILAPSNTTPSFLLVCLPGGGMNRNYFDLPTPEGEPTASFADAMTAKGFAVAMLDPLGIGESSVPADPYELTPEVQARALAAAVAVLVQRVRSGDISGLPALPDIRIVGVGHSYGAALSVGIQARQPTYAGLALFGFGVAPMPRFDRNSEHAVPDAALPVEEGRARLPQAVRAIFQKPYLDIEPTGGERAKILLRANDRLLATTAYSTMLPYLFQTDAAAIDVPVLLAFGDRDLHGLPHDNVRHYPKSNDVTLLVLPETRHNHFTYVTRARLFDRLAQWTQNL
jgi:pimeloyl-ACP methyl ester carboxylesterase